MNKNSLFVLSFCTLSAACFGAEKEITRIDQIPGWTASIMHKVVSKEQEGEIASFDNEDITLAGQLGKRMIARYNEFDDLSRKNLFNAYKHNPLALLEIEKQDKRLMKLTYTWLLYDSLNNSLRIFGDDYIKSELTIAQPYESFIKRLQNGWQKNRNSENYKSFLLTKKREHPLDASVLNAIAEKLQIKRNFFQAKNASESCNIRCFIKKTEFPEVMAKLGLNLSESE